MRYERYERCGHGGEHGGHGPRGGERPRFRGGPFERPFGPPDWGFGPGHFGPGPFGPRGGRGRGRARRGDVRAAILALLKERPMHGYEMIQELSERTQQTWRPSPGSVYPTLQLLDDEGLIVSEESGGKKQYRLTDRGREEAEAGPAEPWADAGRGFDFEALREVRGAVGGFLHAFGQVMQTGQPAQRERALEVLTEARRKMYQILAEE